MYVILSIVAVILVISFALGTVSTTEAALNSINSPSGMASLDVNETEDSKVTIEADSMLVKNGSSGEYYFC